MGQVFFWLSMTTSESLKDGYTQKNMALVAEGGNNMSCLNLWPQRSLYWQNMETVIGTVSTKMTRW